jgi:hypothetical protein
VSDGDMHNRSGFLVSRCKFQCIQSSPDGCWSSRTFGISLPVSGSFTISIRTICSGCTIVFRHPEGVM